MHFLWKQLNMNQVVSHQLWRCAFIVLLLGMISVNGEKPKNVLMLMADDMLPILGCYEGENYPAMATSKMVTPNLDRLASKSVVFEQAFTQYPMCNPSRTSFLTGRRPDTTQVFDLVQRWRDKYNFSTLPQILKENGYTTVGAGKVFHVWTNTPEEPDPISWSEPFYIPPSSRYWSGRMLEKSFDTVNESDTVQPLMDREIADFAKSAIKRLGSEYNDENTPFFLAAGFRLPHLPFITPEQILKNYPLEEVPQAVNPFVPDDMPDVAWPDITFREFLLYKDLPQNYTMEPNSELPAKFTRDLRRAYFASVTYVDSLVGEILSTLKEQRLDKDTIVLFMSDHGFSLGEHSLYGKLANFEIASQTPFMIHVPDKNGGRMKGRREQLVELIDVFPTMMELAGLNKVPVCPERSQNITVCHEGTSLVPMMKSKDVIIKTAAFTQTRRYAGDKVVMGYSMRTTRYRYTEWHDVTDSGDKMDPSTKVACELYDHNTDPQENHNIVNFKRMKDIVGALSRQLARGWRGSIVRYTDNETNVKIGLSSTNSVQASDTCVVPSRSTLILGVLLITMGLVVGVIFTIRKRRKIDWENTYLLTATI